MKPPKPGLVRRIRNHPQRPVAPLRDYGCRWTELPCTWPSPVELTAAQIIALQRAQTETTFLARMLVPAV